MISRGSVTTVAGALALSLIAVSARAADNPAAKSADDGMTAVPVLIGDAVAEYDAGRYEEARALFRLAHEKAPTARTLRGIGMASFEMRDYVEATRALGAALRDQRRPLTAEQRKHAQALLARAETFVGQFTLKLSPASASVFVDGRPAVLEADGSVLLSLGRHEISVRCGTCSPNEKQVPVDVTGGEQKQLEVSLGSGAAPSLPQLPPEAMVGGGGANVPTLVGGGGDAAPEQSSKHLWLAGTAAAATLGAGASALWWWKRQSEVDECRTMATGMCTNESDLTRERGFAIGATIGLGVTAITTGILAAIFWQSDQSAPAASSTVACFSGKDTVGCAFRF